MNFCAQPVDQVDIYQAHEHVENFLHDGVIVEWQRMVMQLIDLMLPRGRVEVTYQAGVYFGACISVLDNSNINFGGQV